MSGATFDWVFPQAFTIRDAPPVDTTSITVRGRETTEIIVRGEVTTEVERQ